MAGHLRLEFGLSFKVQHPSYLYFQMDWKLCFLQIVFIATLDLILFRIFGEYNFQNIIYEVIHNIIVD